MDGACGCYTGEERYIEGSVGRLWVKGTTWKAKVQMGGNMKIIFKQ